MFHGIFDDADSVFSNFRVSDDDRKGVHFLLASYENEDYSGNAMALFIKDGKFWLVTGSHCSCYGLEDQWDPEELTLEELRRYGERSKGGWLQGLNGELLEICKIVENMEAAGKSPESIQTYLKLALG